MRVIDVRQAKTQLLKLIDLVMQGQEFLITVAGKPVATLGPVRKKKNRRLGAYKGKLKISKDFDAPLPDDVLVDFEG